MLSDLSPSDRTSDGMYFCFFSCHSNEHISENVGGSGGRRNRGTRHDSGCGSGRRWRCSGRGGERTVCEGGLEGERRGGDSVVVC